MVLLEAMAYGIPIITTPVGGIPSMLPKNTKSFFFNPGDISALTKGMKDLSDNFELRKQCSMELQDFYKENFSSEIILQKISDFYDSILTPV